MKRKYTTAKTLADNLTHVPSGTYNVKQFSRLIFGVEYKANTYTYAYVHKILVILQAKGKISLSEDNGNILITFH